MFRIDVDGVGPDGRANLKLPTLASPHGDLDVRFISPSRGKRDPSQPLGVARHDFKCEFRVMATPDGVELSPIDFFDCAKEHVVPVPRCSLTALWKKAIARKAPTCRSARCSATIADHGFGFAAAGVAWPAVGSVRL
jgi:hypothetical protein